MAEDDAARDPVDIVLTYVDGAAPGFQDQYRQIVGREATPCHVRSLGEVRYALRSIHQHASWARDVIFLTQDLGHVPAWLNTNRVRVVTLDEFMPPEALPSFNPFAIQAWAHRIDGLARRFVLWSDDQLALCPTRAEDFFDGHGTPKVPTHAGRSFFMVGARWDRFSRRLANSFLALDAITPSGTRGRGFALAAPGLPHPCPGRNRTVEDISGRPSRPARLHRDRPLAHSGRDRVSFETHRDLGALVFVVTSVASLGGQLRGTGVGPRPSSQGVFWAGAGPRGAFFRSA